VKRRRMRLVVVLAVAAVGLTYCSGFGAGDGPPIPLATVDMERIYGGWYLIGTIRNGFEKGMLAPYDIYSKRPDGDIQEDFYFYPGSFHASVRHYQVHDWVRPGTNNAHCRVQVMWPVNLPFLVLYNDPSYRYVLFGEQNRELGWDLRADAHDAAGRRQVPEQSNDRRPQTEVGEPWPQNAASTPAGSLLIARR